MKGVRKGNRQKHTGFATQEQYQGDKPQVSIEQGRPDRFTAIEKKIAWMEKQAEERTKHGPVKIIMKDGKYLNETT